MALATGALPAPSPRGGTTRAGRRRSSPSLAGAPSPIAGDGPPPPSPATGSGRRRPSAPSLPLRPPSPAPDPEWRAAGPSSFPSMAGGRIRSGAAAGERAEACFRSPLAVAVQRLQQAARHRGAAVEALCGGGTRPRPPPASRAIARRPGRFGVASTAAAHTTPSLELGGARARPASTSAHRLASGRHGRLTSPRRASFLGAAPPLCSLRR